MPAPDHQLTLASNVSTGASCWLRCVQRCAGPGHGAQFLPRIVREVLVNFLDRGIDRSAITGGLYNGYMDNAALTFPQHSPQRIACGGEREVAAHVLESGVG